MTRDGLDDLVIVSRNSSSSQVAVHRSFGNLLGAVDNTDHLPTNSPDYVMLGDVNDDNLADLVTGVVVSDQRVDWDVQTSTGCDLPGSPGICFADGQRFINNAGDAGDLFRLGDGNGDGKVDLFYGQAVGQNSLTEAPDLSKVRWFGRLSTGREFGAVTTWRNDAGNEGHQFP